MLHQQGVLGLLDQFFLKVIGPAIAFRPERQCLSKASLNLHPAH
jgi:hypothetical protein